MASDVWRKIEKAEEEYKKKHGEYPKGSVKNLNKQKVAKKMSGTGGGFEEGKCVNCEGKLIRGKCPKCNK